MHKMLGKSTKYVENVKKSPYTNPKGGFFKQFLEGSAAISEVPRQDPTKERVLMVRHCTIQRGSLVDCFLEEDRYGKILKGGHPTCHPPPKESKTFILGGQIKLIFF